MPWNMKKIIIILTSITIVCLGLGFSILTYDGAFSHSNKPTNSNSNLNSSPETKPANSNNTIVSSDEINESYNINEEKTVPIDSAKDISIDIPIGDINFIPEDRTDIKANLHGTIAAGKGYIQPELNVNSDGSKVTIAVKDISNVPTGSTKITLDIHLPSNYSQNITANSSAGNLKLNDMTLNNLDCTAETGDISMQKLKLSALSLKCLTGDVKGTSIESGKTDFDVTTGSVKMDGILGDLTGKISTGSTDISYTNFNNNVNISSTTGSIRLTLPKESEFNMKAESSIGNLSCYFPVNVSKSITGEEAQGTVKSGKNSIRLNVSTGNIIIKD